MPAFTNKGFGRKRESTHSDRIPPGQHETSGFPVLSAGPTRLSAPHRRSHAGGMPEQFRVYPQCFVCGSNGLVENVANTLVDLGVPADTIRTERFDAG